MSQSNHKLPERANQLIPEDETIQQVLKERARQLAIPPVKKLHQTSLIEYVKFCLDENEFYGIAYTSIKEVIDNAAVTRVPYSPSYIAGIFNWRGLLLSVLDLKSFFHHRISPIGVDKSVLVVKVNNIHMGILVHSIEGNNVYDPTKLGLPFSSGGIEPQYLLGLHEGTTAIIDIEVILLKILAAVT